MKGKLNYESTYTVVAYDERSQTAVKPRSKIGSKKEFMRTKIENAKRIDATLMLMLHNVFGFGRERLIRFHNVFVGEYDRLCEDYQDDGAEIAAIKLREATGIDIDELYKQEGLYNDEL